MRIIVSKAYLKWRKSNKSSIALGAIDKFLTRVASAPDAASIIPQPKSAGNNLRKVPGVVDEFALAKEYRVYSKCLALTPGAMTFCLAIAGSKGAKNQSNDILTALGMFDNVDAVDWEEWEPSADLTQALSVAESVEPAPVVPDSTTPDAKTKKTKGKPVDENGMTVAERKALRKKQQQEQMALARQAKKQKQLAEKQKRLAEQQKQMENISALDLPVATNVVENDVEPIAPTIPDVAADSVPVISDNTTPDAKDNQPVSDSPATQNDVDKDVELVMTPVPETVADSATVATPTQPTSDTVDFKDYAAIQYQLEIIVHKMNIERLNIKIAQHEIELEKLALQRLELLQMKKIKSM